MVTGANAGGREDQELMERRHFDLEMDGQFWQGKLRCLMRCRRVCTNEALSCKLLMRYDWERIRLMELFRTVRQMIVW